MSAIDNPFSIVHDTQTIYRLLLNLMSRPGEVGQAVSSASKIGVLPGAGDMALALAFTLLDSEVGYCVDIDSLPELAANIRLRTLSRPVSAESADYIFADGACAPGEWASRLRKGTLSEPETGATVILQIDSLEPGLAVAQADALTLTLAGPGIRDAAHLQVGGLDRRWLTARDGWNEEYPTGVDMILFTAGGQLAALPRTTQVKGV
ncbi:phosphonate C-P lyase system protein PhnH [Paenibacillus lycopersici]|uniref:Phosphonate C-P lyase system protein PhnH n=1 Tax=Paenibacillus lycopersici TaxID=2704462 RepID=A0A6C0G380_9BACL|nr:phosphonate C-P lyase system protein PhnH [Paenibacillus lycopersici]QHT62932.1 phosphonate C-P lyase system protein PhnH [Paenibacillus lycopersici]